MNRPALSVVLAVALVAVPVDYYHELAAPGPPPPGLPLSPAEEGFVTHVQHIIFVVMENHAFDNLFGTYCQQVSPLCPQTAHGIPAGACIPYSITKPNGACIRPWNYTAQNWTLTSPLPHSQASSL